MVSQGFSTSSTAFVAVAPTTDKLSIATLDVTSTSAVELLNSIRIILIKSLVIPTTSSVISAFLISKVTLYHPRSSSATDHPSPLSLAKSITNLLPKINPFSLKSEANATLNTVFALITFTSKVIVAFEISKIVQSDGVPVKKESTVAVAVFSPVSERINLYE